MKRIALLIVLFLPILTTFSQEEYQSQLLKFNSAVTALNISPDGKLILAGFEDGSFRVLDLTTLDILLTNDMEGRPVVYDIEMTPLMDVIFIASGNRIILFDRQGKPIATWRHHRTTIWSMDIDPKGEYLVSAEVNRTFQLWDVFTGTVTESMRGHTEPTLAVAFSPDGKYIASGSNDNEVRLWDVKTRSVEAIFRGHSDNIYDVTFSPDGTLLAACSKDGSIRIWNVETEELVHLLKGHQDMVLEIEFSPDGTYLLSASASFGIKLWDLKTGEDVFLYLGHKDAVVDIEFLPDGKSFVSASMDKTLRKWEIKPEIFVMKYFGEEYEKELSENPEFLPKQKGEKKDDYLERVENAKGIKEEIIQKYYQRYLDEIKQDNPIIGVN